MAFRGCSGLHVARHFITSVGFLFASIEIIFGVNKGYGFIPCWRGFCRSKNIGVLSSMRALFVAPSEEGTTCSGLHVARQRITSVGSHFASVDIVFDVDEFLPRCRPLSARCSRVKLGGINLAFRGCSGLHVARHCITSVDFLFASIEIIFGVNKSYGCWRGCCRSKNIGVGSLRALFVAPSGEDTTICRPFSPSV